MKKKIIKVGVHIYLVLIATLSSFKLLCQEQNVYYARLRLNAIETLEEQQQITDYIRSKPGVSVCRTDRRTDVLFVLYDESVSLDFLEGWLQELGVEVKCLVYGNTNDEQIKELPCQQDDFQIAIPQK